MEKAATEEGGSAGQPQAASPPRALLELGALAVFLQASSITEIRLGVPALSIRLGLQVCGCVSMPDIRAVAVTGRLMPQSASC